MTRPEEQRSERSRQEEKKPRRTDETGHERPLDDPGRGQGDILEDKIPDESKGAGRPR